MTRYDRYGEEIEDLGPEIVLTTYRRSRFTRQCAACGGEILPGELYTRRFLPPDAEHDEAMTVIEHASAGTCYAVTGGES